MKAHTRLIVAAVAAALALSACGGGDTATADQDGGSDAQPAAAADAVTVTAKEFEFDPGSLTIASGATVRLENQGVIEHDFVVEGHEDLEIYAPAGETAEGTIDIPAGDYTFFCSIPGHRQSGMEGDLTVQ